MPSYSACRSLDVNASPEACFDALVDYEHLPEWQGAVVATTVVERDAEGRGRVIDYEVNARLATVRYRLEQHYERPSRITSRYLSGDFRAMDGQWRLDARAGGGTRAAFELSIDPGRAVPRPVRRMLAEVVVRGALQDLRAHVDDTG